ncbi:hypothetical protein AKJ18_00815 [Vibrio xuii]|nr:hypothetical protein AKJ18_00815 [Vibrio xuii]
MINDIKDPLLLVLEKITVLEIQISNLSKKTVVASNWENSKITAESSQRVRNKSSFHLRI